jgi:hypothetical protein
MKLVALGTSTAKDRAEFVVDDIFDSYVNPKVSPALWDDSSIEVHGIVHMNRGIRSAKQDDDYGASNIVLPCPGS